jgi:dTDP-4-dehydrorhamnose 3,5-epimerase
MPFTFTSLDIPEIILVEPAVFADNRGVFFETFKMSDFRKLGVVGDFLQDNQSVSSRGVLRGLHYQIPPYAQAKIVRVIVGSVLDVVVDVRKSSSSFGKWAAHELSDDNNHMLYIPEGFAHGFLTLSDKAIFVYKCTAEYSRNAEAGIRWDDPKIGIEWPTDIVKVSAKDAILPGLSSAVTFD